MPEYETLFPRDAICWQCGEYIDLAKDTHYKDCIDNIICGDCYEKNLNAYHELINPFNEPLEEAQSA